MSVPKWNCWFSTINLLLPESSHLLHYQLLNSQTKRSSFDFSLFLTPLSNPFASDFSSTPQRDLKSIHLSPLPHTIIFCLDDYKSPVFVTLCCCNSYEGWFPGNLFFIFCLRKDRISLTFLFPINTYEAPTVDRHCFCILTKNVMDNSKYKEVNALLDRKGKYSTL